MESSLLFFPATLDALPQAQACIAACRQEVDADTVLRMQLAIEELFVNSVHYFFGNGRVNEVCRAYLNCRSARQHKFNGIGSVHNTAKPYYRNFDSFCNLPYHT